jgi:hypothetical protein
VTQDERSRVDAADFALDDWEHTGLVELVYVTRPSAVRTASRKRFAAAGARSSCTPKGRQRSI